MEKKNSKNDLYISKSLDVNIEDDENSEKDYKLNLKEKKNGFFYEWGIPIIVAVILATLINKFVVFKVFIPSESMVPTLNVKDRLFVTRVYKPKKLERGDIVVFYSDELQDSLIKRLIGLPGDKVKIVDGVVYVNGERLDEPYIGAADRFNGEYDVPEGKYFFLGDNRLWSKDSRYWINPYIDGKDIKGKAQIKVYPFSEIGKLK
ncbi:signal peptidase I [Clostridium carnis]